MSTDAQSWDSDMESLAAPSISPLLQSWAWGNVQAKAGWSVERVRLKDAMASVQLRGIGGSERLRACASNQTPRRSWPWR